jgi:cytochrome c oxidase subunit 2
VVTAGKEHDLVVDEDYLKRSMLEPQADIVKGFPPIMPSQKGLLKDEEIDAIIQYLKTLSPHPAVSPRDGGASSPRRGDD